MKNTTITLKFGFAIPENGGMAVIDYAVPYGTPIKASNSGKVIFSGWYGGYGKYCKTLQEVVEYAKSMNLLIEFV